MQFLKNPIKNIWRIRMIINPFLNNPKTLNYQWSNSIYKPKTKKMEFSNNSLKLEEENDKR